MVELGEFNLFNMVLGINLIFDKWENFIKYLFSY